MCVYVGEGFGKMTNMLILICTFDIGGIVNHEIVEEYLQSEVNGGCRQRQRDREVVQITENCVRRRVKVCCGSGDNLGTRVGLTDTTAAEIRIMHLEMKGEGKHTLF